MEKKKFNEYTKDEKIKILDFWFYYYGKDLVTLDEIHQFEELSAVNPDRIFDYIAVSYVVNGTIAPSVLLTSMRMDKLDELFEAVPSIASLDEKMQEAYSGMYYDLVDAIVKDMNNPEPAIPMDIVITIEEEPKQK